MTHPLKKLAAAVAFVLAYVVHGGCGPSGAPPQPDGGLQRVSGFTGGISPQGGTVTAGTGMTTGYLQVATGPQSIGNYAGSGPCGAGSAVTAIGSNGVVTCGQAGVSNSAGSNFLTKSTGVGSGLVASSLSDDGVSITTPETITVNGGAAIQSNGNIVTAGGTIEGSLLVGGGGNFSVFVGGGATTGQIGFQYFTAGAATGYINNVSDGGGTANFRSLEIDDGKGSGGTGGSHYIAIFDGTSRTATFDNVGFNGSAATSLNMNSHQITGLANGALSSDAAAFGQIATAVNAGVSGTANFIPKFTGTHAIGNSSMADDGTSVIITSGGIFSVNESTGATTVGGVLTANGNLVSSAGTTTFGNVRGVLISPTLTAGTTNDWAPTGYATSENIYVFCNAGACTLTGLQGGADGRHIRIVNTGSSLLSIPNASGLSLAGNRFNNSQYGGTVNLIGNSGCEVDYVFSTASNFWTETGFTCTPYSDDGTTVTLGRNLSVVGTAQTSSWFTAGTSIYAGGNTATEYLSSGAGAIGHTPSLNCLYSTNAAATCYINTDGYAEGSTQPRDLWIQDGQGSGSGHSIAEFAATGHATSFFGNVTSSGRFISATGAGTPPMFDWKQTGQTEWQLYQTGSTNSLELWNSTVGADITTWDLNGLLTHTKAASFTGTTSAVTFTNTPVGGGGSPNGTHIERFDDMLGEIPSTVTAGGSASVGDWTLYTSGTGAQVAENYDGTNGLGRPGQRSFAYSASSTSGNYAAMAMGKTFYFPDGTSTMEFAVEWPTLSSTALAVASPYVSQMGFDDGYTGVAPTNGCYFAYDAANQLTGGVNSGTVQALECWCAKNGTRTGYLINNTGNSDGSFPLGVGTVAAATWYRLKVVVNGVTPKAEFYRNNTKVCEIDTNIPNTSTLQTQPAVSIITKQTSGTGTRLMSLDWADVQIDLTAVRSP